MLQIATILALASLSLVTGVDDNLSDFQTTEEGDLTGITDTNDDEYDDCTDDYYDFAYGTYTITDGDVADVIEECQFCFCYTEEATDGSYTRTKRCEEAEWDGLWNKIESYCDLDCSSESAVWSDDSCQCPSCEEDDDTLVDNGTDDDDDLYSDDERESWSSDYDDSSC